MNIKFNNDTRYGVTYLEQLKAGIDKTKQAKVTFDATDNHPPTAFINNIINYIVATKGLAYAQRTTLIGFNESATRTITTYLTWE